MIIQLRIQAKKTNFELALILSIAYACNIEGMGTLIGTPPNALLAAFMLENYELNRLLGMDESWGSTLGSIVPLLYFVLTDGFQITKYLVVKN